jgi:dTDP-4-dehydrorhamnose reductase
MKILVLGGEGMLGHKMFQVLSARYPETHCTIFGSLKDPFYRSVPIFSAPRTIENINAPDLASLRQMMESIQADFIINCVGIIKQRHEAKAAIPSITLNSLLPHLLADWSATWQGRIVHFSTDCVFSGNKGHYSEDDSSDTEDLYGRSKYLGEVIRENALTLRTSIIGRELDHFQSLLEWFLAKSGQGVKGFRRVICSGVTTNYCADLVSNIIVDHPLLSGLYQVTAPAINKFELLCRLRDAFRLDVNIIPDDTEFSDRSMHGERFLRATGYAAGRSRGCCLGGWDADSGISLRRRRGRRHPLGHGIVRSELSSQPR